MKTKTQRKDTKGPRHRGQSFLDNALRLCSFAPLRYAPVLIVIAACGPIVPATTPPQLKFTPGPAVIVTDRTFQSEVFTARYPSGWRVVTGAADAPLSVVFVAPDEVSTITLQVGRLDEAQIDSRFQTDVRGVALEDGTQITAVGRAPAEQWTTFLPVFEAVVASVGSR